MKINSIGGQNLKGTNSLKFVPKKLNFFTGPSGTGKSSALDVIRFGLTGKPPKDGIHTGKTTMSVELDLDGIGVISRTQTAGKPMKVKMNGKTTTGKSVMDLIEKLSGCSAVTTGLMTSSEVVRKKDLAAYLLNEGLLENDMTLDRLLDLCPSLTESAKNQLYEMLPVPPTPITLQNIDEAHDTVTSQRAAFKKLLAESQARARYDGTPPTRAVEQIQKEIADANKALGAFRAESAKYPKLKEAFEHRKSVLLELRDKLKSLSTVTAVSDGERKAVDENVRQTLALISDTEAIIRSVKKDIEAMGKVMDALSKPICPISSSLACTTDKTAVSDELEIELDGKRAQLDILSTKLEQYRRDYTAAVSNQESLAGQIRAYQQKLSIKKQLDDMETMEIELPPEPDYVREEALVTQVSVLDEELKCAQQYERANMEKARADLYARNVETSELLAKELAPNGGVRKQVLIHSIGPLEDWCNEKLSIVLPKYKMYFDPEQDFEIMLRDSTGDSISFDGISTGERLRLGLVLMSMLNALNGFRILLLDDVNSLDLENFKLLIQLIRESEGEYDHVFIAGLDNTGFVDAVESSGISNKTC